MGRNQFWSNEEHRWSYMTEEQLARRLKKITREGKLQCFIDMASLRGNDYLYDLALERKQDLGLMLEAKGFAANGGVTVEAEVKEKWEVTKEKEISDRYVDF